MRIAHVSDWFLPRLGGIELQIRDLSVELKRSGCDVAIHTTTPGATEVAGIPVARTPATLAPHYGFALWPRLTATIRNELAAGDFGVVHIHMSIVSPLGYAAIRATRDLGLPTIVTYHSILGATGRILRMADRLTGWSRSPLLVLTGVSEAVAGELRRALPVSEIHVLPNGTDLGFWHRPQSALRDEDEIVFVSAMRLSPRKRPLALLRAFRRAQSSIGNRRLSLRIAGEGSERGKLERYIAYHALSNVTLLGLQSRGALRRLYAASHVFVLPSIQEAFGIAALEARCASLPVIAMRKAGCSDFLRTPGQGQILVDDDAQLAEQIARLATDNVLRNRLSRNDDGLSRFSWSNVTAAHLALYREVAARSA